VSFPTDDEPRPRPSVSTPPRIPWPVVRSIHLPPVVRPPFDDVAVVMERRRSVRHIDATGLREIANMIAWVVAPAGVSVYDGIQRSKSLAASSGGLHAVEPILVPPAGSRAFRFDGGSGRMEVLKVNNRSLMAAFRRSVGEMAPQSAACHVVVFAADMPRARACYESADSLVLRDAGVLQQTFHLAVEAYRMSALPLGILGRQAVEAILPTGSGVEAVGAIIIGRRRME
jgi:hypothetical protein